ncbi:MAG: RsmE family RNA methyltransferase [Planctomycetota bacterium]|jgi:16S rRNA (uracil1498-N3)-methyltransferase
MPPSDATGASRRFYVPQLEEGRAILSSDQAHHAANVLRLSAGDAVVVFDGLGQVAQARIDSAGRKGVTLTVGAVAGPQERPQPVIEIAFAVPKGKRVDWLVEKATELGAAALQPVVFERSVAGGGELSPAKRQRWLGHCIAAARQCELDFLPELLPPRALSAYLGDCAATWKLFGDVAEHGPSIAAALGDWQAGQPIAILVGPEGDLTDAERSAAVDAGFRPAHLGHTVLRVETAAVALTAALVAVCDASGGQSPRQA